MKIMIPGILLMGALAAAAFFATRPKPSITATSATASIAPIVQPPPAAAMVQGVLIPAAPALPEVKKVNDPAVEFAETVGLVLSPEATFAEREAAWEHLDKAGQLEHAVTALERMAEENPDSPPVLVALGRGYMLKSRTIADIVQVGILGAKIDESFNTALKVDPVNWDAQYYKAVALSFYPAFMNKGPEVLQTFQALIRQQEQQTPQPQFVDSYLRLGDEYQKQGNADFARQTWQRGAELFPDNSALQQKLTPPAAQP